MAFILFFFNFFDAGNIFNVSGNIYLIFMPETFLMFPMAFILIILIFFDTRKVKNIFNSIYFAFCNSKRNCFVNFHTKSDDNK